MLLNISPLHVMEMLSIVYICGFLLYFGVILPGFCPPP